MKSFDFFSLDYFYYPVSGIMWVWHKIFGSFLGDNNAWAWVLSVVFLVFTLRSLLFKPFMGQMNSQMKMQAVAPQMKKIREKYKDDKTRLAEELQKFNKEAGVNPLGGCLPALVQAPVFISLYHVLRSFKPNQGENYFFGREDVASFVQAKLFGGAPLSAYMTQPWVTTAKQVGLGPDGLNGIRSTVIAVGIPLTILAAIATHLSSRRSIARTQRMQTEPNPQAAIMNKLMLYVFPLGVLAFGAFFPLAIAIYYLSNNTWTFGQLFVAHRIQDKQMDQQAMIVEAAKEQTKFSKPQPGARPGVTKPAATKPAPGVKPAPGAKPVRPATTGRPATATRTPGGRPTTAAQRPVVQPSAKGKATTTRGTAGGSAGNGDASTTSGGADVPTSVTNGAVKPAASSPMPRPHGSSPVGSSPSLTKPSSTVGSSSPSDSPGGRGSALTPGGVGDGSQPKPASTATRKKKPGRR